MTQTKLSASISAAMERVVIASLYHRCLNKTVVAKSAYELRGDIVNADKCSVKIDALIAKIEFLQREEN